MSTCLQLLFAVVALFNFSKLTKVLDTLVTDWQESINQSPIRILIKFLSLSLSLSIYLSLSFSLSAVPPTYTTIMVILAHRYKHHKHHILLHNIVIQVMPICSCWAGLSVACSFSLAFTSLLVGRTLIAPLYQPPDWLKSP